MTRYQRQGWTLVLLSLLAGCALWQLGTPPKPSDPPPCKGRFIYPDSAGHCVPKDST